MGPRPATKNPLQNFPPLKDIQRDYSPEGPATVTHKFWKDARGAWHKTWHIAPEGMSARYALFSYVLAKITGSLTYETASDRSQSCTVNRTGESAGRKVHITGRTSGDGVRPGEVALKIHGDSIPLDEKLRRALQGPSRTAFDEFHPRGLADVDITISRALGSPNFTNRYLVHVHDAAFPYDQFPLSLKTVTGVLDLLPNHWWARAVRGTPPDAQWRC